MHHKIRHLLLIVAMIVALVVLIAISEQGGLLVDAAIVNQLPYGNGGNPWPIADGVRIEAENFDDGGEGVAYHDTTTGNSCGYIAYRDTDVDIQVIVPGDGGGYSIAYIEPGEWLEYTVQVAVEGMYSISVSVGTPTQPDNPAVLYIKLDDIPLCTLSFADTGGWHNWETYTCTERFWWLATPGLEDVLRIEVAEGSGSFNINWVEFSGPKTYYLPLVLMEND